MSSIKATTANPATLMSNRYKLEQIPDLSGRVALVTGGSAGIGFNDAVALALRNAQVIMVSADEEHGKRAEAELNDALKQQGSSGSVKWYQVNFEKLRDVDAFAKQMAEQEPRSDILILNAGIAQVPFGLTGDGLERHFQVSLRWIRTSIYTR